ncbi:SH3 domain-containing protein [Bradyrhizobium barranii subsp. barranii]|uniref:SH3 domain-containing protein n=1 Tax=Bradyrhizobium barranii subsp. barranii TaxID=2823807 RepID=A0A9X9YD06_9BRAD|nr:SH3 domain-containing protein [Bradyrhizobium barranii]UEM17800.1 SH3 domain-containing protein [Bradyrhizobium barranii subsp. barranii]
MILNSFRSAVGALPGRKRPCWAALRRRTLPLERIVALCVGDTIDFRGPGRGRQAFPHNKEELIAKTNGQAMFDIARKALEDMAAFVPGYQGAVANPKKFCHGFGVFQRDLQFFKDDPEYFLERRYESFANSLKHCLGELQRRLRKFGFESRTSLTDLEFAKVAIVYNTGGYNSAKGLKQGTSTAKKYYGERIFDFLELCRTVAAGRALAAGRYVVIARGGLKLRGGPGANFESEKTLPAGTELNVVENDSQEPSWVCVDLEGDGLLDGYVFASFLAPAERHVAGREDVPEPADDMAPVV